MVESVKQVYSLTVKFHCIFSLGDHWDSSSVNSEH